MSTGIEKEKQGDDRVEFVQLAESDLSILEIVDLLVPMQEIENDIRSVNLSDGSFRTTLIRDACVKEGIDTVDPGKVRQYWLKDEGIIITDLRGGEDGG